jgi:hypothetical protein
VKNFAKGDKELYRNLPTKGIQNKMFTDLRLGTVAPVSTANAQLRSVESHAILL